MEISDKRIDDGKAFDWGKTSKEYAKFRDIYPEEFYKKIVDRRLCIKGQKVLDLGTGTGVVPRNMYKYGAEWTGTDISPEQIEQAKFLAADAGMKIDFIAAATEQLVEWTKRADVPVITGAEGADPASVVYDAVHAAQARDIDMLIIDTAGRLHNKKNLMEELAKMNRIIDKELPFWNHENLIVLDGTTGQNGLTQAREFFDVAKLSGIILTKLDGTSKGGIAVAIVNELGIPVKYVGIGEGIDDMTPFDPDEYVRALFPTQE